MSKLLIFLMAMSMIACSGSKSVKKAEAEDLGVELTDSEEFLEDKSGEEIIDAEAAMAEMEKGEDAELGTTAEALEGEQVAITEGGIEEYTVSKNETLMIIAFKIYGDYNRWRDLQEMNPQADGDRLAVGTRLKYNAPAERFVWNPEGNPYMIKQGDTLGTISSDTYGTEKHWKDIWENNKPLIQDPNKIFAGFTLYTPIIKERGVANEM